MPRPPTTLTNPWSDVPEEELDRIQADIPRKSKAYLVGLLGRRGIIQEIINTTLANVEHACRTANLIGYDVTNEEFIAEVLGRLNEVELGRLANGPEKGVFDSSTFPDPLTSTEDPEFIAAASRQSLAAAGVKLTEHNIAARTATEARAAFTSGEPDVSAGSTPPGRTAASPARQTPTRAEQPGGHASDVAAPSNDANSPADAQGKPNSGKPSAARDGKGQEGVVGNKRRVGSGNKK